MEPQSVLTELSLKSLKKRDIGHEKMKFLENTKMSAKLMDEIFIMKRPDSQNKGQNPWEQEEKPW